MFDCRLQDGFRLFEACSHWSVIMVAEWKAQGEQWFQIIMNNFGFPSRLCIWGILFHLGSAHWSVSKAVSDFFLNHSFLFRCFVCSTLVRSDLLCSRSIVILFYLLIFNGFYFGYKTTRCLTICKLSPTWTWTVFRIILLHP